MDGSSDDDFLCLNTVQNTGQSDEAAFGRPWFHADEYSNEPPSLVVTQPALGEAAPASHRSHEDAAASCAIDTDEDALLDGERYADLTSDTERMAEADDEAEIEVVRLTVALQRTSSLRRPPSPIQTMNLE
mmetsp:Transcript_20133/g.30094  ORF Transcript_20133/g.30094 Transcript_20133/m.30094 type:complete len:131 (+) Transcript_20133:86-478(+)